MTLAITPTFTDAFRAVPTPVAALAARIDGVEHAMVVSSFVALSDAPALVSVAIKDGSTSWPVLRTAPRLGISFLTADHEDLLAAAWRLPSHERLRGVALREAAAGALQLALSPVALTCQIVQETRVGDHTLVVFEVTDAHLNDAANPPVVHHRRRVTELAVKENT